MSENIIELKNVNKWFGDFQVLKNVDLTVGLKQKIVVALTCGRYDVAFGGIAE